jgi:hypothetical protein
MFKKILSRFAKRPQTPPGEPVGPYLVLSWEAVNNSLGKTQLATLETLITQVVENAPQDAHQNLVVMKMPAETSRQLIDLATAPAPLVRH